jgi:two-component system nitrogen regulation response regulator GlnG
LMRRLVRHDWPGNVRELLQIVNRLVISNRGRAVAELSEKLASRLDAGSRTPVAPAPPAAAASVSEPPPPPAPPAKRRPAEISDEEIRKVLREHRWEVKRAADALGIARNTLYDRIEASSLMRAAKDIGRDELLAVREECNGELDAMVERLEISKGALRQRMRQLGLG